MPAVPQIPQNLSHALLLGHGGPPFPVVPTIPLRARPGQRGELPHLRKQVFGEWSTDYRTNTRRSPADRPVLPPGHRSVAHGRSFLAHSCERPRKPFLRHRGNPPVRPERRHCSARRARHPVSHAPRTPRCHHHRGEPMTATDAPPFVGRDAELDALCGLVAGGPERVAVVRGEPGIGEDGAARARGRPGRGPDGAGRRQRGGVAPAVRDPGRPRSSGGPAARVPEVQREASR